jgi:NAD(P)-dependent dehydrogenase (short-subunit alcohol dehydrogenase family)
MSALGVCLKDKVLLLLKPQAGVLIADKVAIVTGGASGIGLATVNLFLEASARVAVIDIKGLGTLPEHEHLFPVLCDVSKLDEVKSAIEAVVRKWGRIDVLINNAGVADNFGEFHILLSCPASYSRSNVHIQLVSPTQQSLYGSGP